MIYQNTVKEDCFKPFCCKQTNESIKRNMFSLQTAVNDKHGLFS